MCIFSFRKKVMSFDQSLICHGNGGIYAVPWMAGTSGSQALAKYYKNNDIDCVNVGKTCDALRLALKSEASSVQQTLGAVNTENYMVKEGTIPFRVCTNIWFGALKIYQQQVNNLYKLSEDLVACSSCYDIQEKSRCRKGNSSDSHNKPYKKRRLTITKSSKIGLSNENYSELLDDFEKWTQQMPGKQSDEPDMLAQLPTVRPRAHLQIREITIREISATSYGISELDDDDGFGEATSEEITQFFTFPSGREQNSFLKRSLPKQKSNYEDEPPHKFSRYSHDTTMENERSGTTPLASDFFPTPIRFQRTCGSVHTPTKHYDTTTYHECEQFTIKNNTSTVSLNEIKEESHENPHAMTSVPALFSEDIEKKEFANDCGNINRRKKISKLIIDQYIKIEQEDMLQQLNAQTKLLRGNMREIIQKCKYKKRTPASEILKRLNKRTERFCQLLKQKNAVITCQSQFEYEYIQLLHDILKTDYKDEWATEVYPKWKKVYQAPTKRKQHTTGHITRETLKQTRKSPTNLNFLCENSLIVFSDENKNSKPNYQKYSNVTPTHGKNKEIFLNSETSNEWRPYGVMMKLLKIWRYFTETEIAAVDFCNSATVVTDKALAFSSLLSLSKDQFIELTKRPETINMDKIILGKTVKNLMEAEN